jgi:hypothetical protein
MAFLKSKNIKTNGFATRHNQLKEFELRLPFKADQLEFIRVSFVRYIGLFETYKKINEFGIVSRKHHNPVFFTRYHPQGIHGVNIPVVDPIVDQQLISWITKFLNNPYSIAIKGHFCRTLPGTGNIEQNEKIVRRVFDRLTIG